MKHFYFIFFLTCFFYTQSANAKDLLLKTDTTVIDSMANSVTKKNTTIKSTSIASSITPAGIPSLPSPQAAGLMRQAAAKPNLYTGAPMVQVPLHNLVAKEFSVPISLVYSTKGVRVDEVEGIVGTSWQLQAGGAVTRVMRGYPDEVNAEGKVITQRKGYENFKWVLEGMIDSETDFNWLARSFYSGTVNDLTEAQAMQVFVDANKKKIVTKQFKGLLHCHLLVDSAISDYESFEAVTQINNEEDNAFYDTEPDKFFFSAPGLSGSFFIDPKNRTAPIVHSEEKLAIVINWDDDMIKGFVVINSSGTHYEFGGNEDFQEQQSVESSTFTFSLGNDKVGSGMFSQKYLQDPLLNFEITTTLKMPEYTSAWYLKRITAPLQHDEITFSYRSLPPLTYTQSRQLKASLEDEYNEVNEKGYGTSLFLGDSHPCGNAGSYRWWKLHNGKRPDNSYFISQSYNVIRNNVTHHNRKILHVLSSSLQNVHLEYSDLGMKPQLKNIWINNSDNNRIKGYKLAYKTYKSNIADYKSKLVPFKGAMLYDKDKFLGEVFDFFGGEGTKQVRRVGEDTAATERIKRQLDAVNIPDELLDRSFLSNISEMNAQASDSIDLFNFTYHGKLDQIPHICSWHQNFYGFGQQIVSHEAMLKECTADVMLRQNKSSKNISQIIKGYFGANYIDFNYIDAMAFEENGNTTISQDALDDNINAIKTGMLSTVTNSMGGVTSYNYYTEAWGNRLDEASTEDGKNNVISSIAYTYGDEAVPLGCNSMGAIQGGQISLMPKGNSEQMLTQGSVVGYGKVEMISIDNKEVLTFTTANTPDYDNVLDTFYHNIGTVADVKFRRTGGAPTYNVFEKYSGHVRTAEKLKELLNKYSCSGNRGTELYGKAVFKFNSLNSIPLLDIMLDEYNILYGNSINHDEEDGTFHTQYKYSVKSDIGFSNMMSKEAPNKTFGKATNRDALRGKLLTHRIYKGNNLITAKSTKYKKVRLTKTDYKPLAITTVDNGIGEANNGLMRYGLDYWTLMPTSTREVAYISKKDSMVTESTFAYDTRTYNEGNVIYTQFLLNNKSVENKNTGDIISEAIEYDFIGNGKPTLGTYTPYLRPIKEEKHLQKGANGQKVMMEGSKITYDTTIPWQPKVLKQYIDDSYESVIFYDEYDDAGRILEMHGSNGIYESVRYNTDGLPELTATNCRYAAINNTIPVKELRTSLREQGAIITNVTYDAFGRVNKKFDGLNNYVGYRYDDFGRLTYVYEGIADSNGDYTTSGLQAYQYRYGNAQSTTEHHTDFSLENMVIGESFQIDGYDSTTTTGLSNIGINAVTSYTYKKDGITYSNRFTTDPAHANVSISYQDGLGRSIQQVAYAALPGGQSVVSSSVYDDHGRTPISYLPYIGNAPQGYVSDWRSQLSELYGEDSTAFTQSKAYGNYGEVTAQGGVGAHYQISPSFVAGQSNDATSHFTTFGSALNQSTWRGFQIDDTGIITRNYAPKTIAINTTTVEGVVMREYKDSYGRTLCKETETTEELLATHYIYDDYNNRLAIIPPLANDATNHTLTSDYSAYIYRYHYDKRNRLWKKEIPASEPIYMAYDEQERPLLEQDAKGVLTYIHYDDVGRATETGVLLMVKDQFNMMNYPNHTFRLVHAAEAVTIEAKDISTKGNAFVAIATSVEQRWLSQTQYDTYTATYGLGYSHVSDAYLTYPTGAVTGTKTRILGRNGNAGSCYIESAMFYNQRGRAVYALSTNPMGGVDHTYSTYSWTGQLKEQNIIKSVKDQPSVRVDKQFEYFHNGNLKRVLHAINDQTPVELARLEYDSHGRLAHKYLHGGALMENYTYDATNRMVEKQTLKVSNAPTLSIDTINAVAGERIPRFAGDTLWCTNDTVIYDKVYTQAPNVPIFRLQLAYDDLAQIDPHGDLPGAEARYDGNISVVKWQNRQETEEYYTLDYNTLGNLVAANGRDSRYSAYYDYDLHGNLQTLQRTNGWKRKFNDFTYHYTGNRLDSLTRHTVVTHQMYPGDMDNDGQVHPKDNMQYDRYADSTLYTTAQTPVRTEPGSERHAYTLRLNGQQEVSPYYADANGDGKVDTCDAHIIKTHMGDTYHPTPPTQGTTYRYEYDESGNMIYDEYKGVNIHYNVLNLPDTITIVNRGQIVNTYLADGTLIRRQYYACTTVETPSANIPLLRGGRGVFQLTRTTDYGGMFLYENGQLEKIFTDGGYVQIEDNKEQTTLNYSVLTFNYNYVVTDHLGHTRAVVSSEGEVLDEHAYYPYGMEIAHLSSGDFDYLYTGKEQLTYAGLNYTDHHARLWDYETGRWNAIDPQLQMHSPYAGMGMNPMAFVDPDGESFTLAALGVVALNAAITSAIVASAQYSMRAAAFNSWDWGEFGKTVGIGAAMGAVSGGLAYGVGEVGSTLVGAGMSKIGAGVITTSLHLGTQGALAEFTGGDFWSSATAGALGHVGGSMSKGMGTFGRAAMSSAFGGFGSMITGGSFFDGATTGLIVFMCNSLQHEGKEADAGKKGDAQADGGVRQAGEDLPDMKKNPPNHPDYKAPKSGPRKVPHPRGRGWIDNKGRIWVPGDHKGTHAPHWDRQEPKGGYTPVYPSVDPGFMDTMSEITGLTGTALLIYVVISEGSRLFPPRNLVPIP